MANPWLNSADLINTIKRKVSVPASQNLFSDADFLAFCNDEMFTSLVPSILDFHEEYFVFTQTIPLVANQSRYPIPNRAIGMKLRDVKWQDSNGNLFDMSRVNPEDKAFYQINIGTSTTLAKYYIEGNDVVLLPVQINPVNINLVFYYFLRPNQLVDIARAATITAFANQITVINSSILANDTVTINGVTFTAVSGTPSGTQFQIGASDIATATNLTNAINSNGIALANNGSPSTSLVGLSFATLAASQLVTTSNSAGFIIPITKQLIQFNQVPTTYQDPSTLVTTTLFAPSATVDFLQTLPGHRTYAFDVVIPTNGISGTTISFNLTDVPSQLIVGDYVCLSNECIIPQIPPDLHNALAQRAASMVLAALGDQAGLQASMAKVQEMEQKHIGLLDSRVEGSPLKVVNHKSILRWQSSAGRRRRL